MLLFDGTSPRRAIVLVRPGSIAVALLLVVGSLPLCALAATPTPDAGVILQNIKPVQPLAPASPASALPAPAPLATPTAPGGATVTVTAFHISGATAFPEATLQALLADALGKPLTMADIKDKLEQITDYYHRHGYLLARAWLPPQQIKDGSVEVRVLEGQLGHINLRNQSLLSDAAVRRQLQQLPEGQPVQAAALNRDLMLLNELPGAVVRSTLKPGDAVGSTDLDVAVGASSRVGGSLIYNNDGNRYTGSNQLTGVVRVSSPTGEGDALNLQTLLARGIDYARLGYQIPVGDYGTQVGGGASVLDYKLGGDFAALQAHGSASDFSLLGLQPLLRSREGSLDVEATLDHKRLDDVIDAFPLKNINAAAVTLSGQQNDSGGQTTDSLTLTDGHINLDTALATPGQPAPVSGHYDKLDFQLSRQQILASRLTLNGQLSGQWADKGLDSTEKMSLGGASAVRAYAPGESSSDEALLARLELRYAVTEEWQAGAFADGARALLNKHPLATDPANGRNLAGEGVSLYWSRSTLAAQAFVAWRDGDAPTTGANGRARVGVQLTAYFF